MAAIGVLSWKLNFIVIKYKLYKLYVYICYMLSNSITGFFWSIMRCKGKERVGEFLLLEQQCGTHCSGMNL